MPLDLSAVDRLVQELARQNTAAPLAHSGDDIGSAPYLAMGAGHGLDLASTLDAKRRGLREANPLIGQGNARLLAAKGAGALVTALAMRMLDKRGHDKAAKWIGYGTGIGMGALGARNFATGRK